MPPKHLLYLSSPQPDCRPLNMSKRSLINLQNLSKDELIKLITEKLPFSNEFMETKAVNQKKERVERTFVPTAYESKMVALKVAYFGFKYQGFASQTGLLNIFNGSTSAQSTADTVEDHLFRAMIRTRLILDPLACNYNRCGRTDAGVSSTGQVVALRLRTSNQKASESKGTLEGIDYVNVINKQLPEDIRILDWAFVPDDFSARFSCSARLYHYYFASIHFDSVSRKTFTLDIGKMQEAAKLLIGVHDFRNFCKRDPSKPGQSFIREILECFVEESGSTRGFYRFVCKGSAFLYHQIRCIMAILFMIGMGKEPVELVQLMLEKIESKKRVEGPAGPLIHYEIASGTPLTLHCCFYEKPGSEPIKWSNKNGESNSMLSAHLVRSWESKQAEAMIIRGLLATDFPLRPPSPTDSNLLLNLFKAI